MSDDRFDDELRGRLRGSGPAAGDARHELSSLRPRFERARRRRATAMATGSAAALAIVVVGALSLSGTSRDERVQVADSSAAPRSSTTTSTTTTTSSTTTTVGPTPVPPTTMPSTTIPAVPTTVPVPAGPVPSSATSAPAVGPPATSPAPASTTVAPGGQRVLSSDGGTATVTWTATSIVVDRTDPAAGWTLEQIEQKEPTRIVVKFRREVGGPGSSSASIDARVVAGQLQVN